MGAQPRRPSDAAPGGEVSFLPIDPILFGDPLPRLHPWASNGVRYGAWEITGTIRAHVVPDGTRCTLCRRGVAGCVAMRVTRDWRRATCARCIRNGLLSDGEAFARARDLGRPFRRHHWMGLARSIGWWRLCGASATSFPDYLNPFFLKTDMPERIVDAGAL